jgi:hypothetical protein
MSYVLVVVIFGTLSGDVRSVLEAPNKQACEDARAQLIAVPDIDKRYVLCLPGALIRNVP